MITEPDERTDPSDVAAAVLRTFSNATRVPAEFGARLREHHSPTAELRGGAYPRPEDYKVTRQMSGVGEVETLDDDWTDTRIHLRITDFAEQASDRATVVHMEPHAESEIGEETWIVVRESLERRLIDLFAECADDDWEVFQTCPAVNEAVRSVSVRLVDEREIEEESAPFRPYD